MAKTVRRIEAKSAVDTARKRVAAYARVSMETIGWNTRFRDRSAIIAT